MTNKTIKINYENSQKKCKLRVTNWLHNKSCIYLSQTYLLFVIVTHESSLDL